MNHSENIENREISFFLDPSRGRGNFIFLIFSSGGGTGHGFFRTISKKINNLDRVIPIIVFPQIDPLKDADEVILNSYAAYGRICNCIDKFRSVILIDNNNFYEKFNKLVDLEKINKCIAGYIGTMADAAGLMEICYRNINVGGALSTAQTSGKFATIGFGSSLFIPEDNVSARNAMEKACTSTLCDIIDDGKKNGIAFVIIPHRANIYSVRRAIQECSQRNKIDISDRIFISHANTYTVDIVLLIFGKIIPKFLKYPVDELPYEGWYKRTMLMQLEKLPQFENKEYPESEISELQRSADEDFERGFKARI